MLGDISGLEKIYIVCGYTDMRKSIDGLCAVIEDQLWKLNFTMDASPSLNSRSPGQVSLSGSQDPDGKRMMHLVTQQEV